MKVMKLPAAVTEELERINMKFSGEMARDRRRCIPCLGTYYATQAPWGPGPKEVKRNEPSLSNQTGMETITRRRYAMGEDPLRQIWQDQ